MQTSCEKMALRDLSVWYRKRKKKNKRKKGSTREWRKPGGTERDTHRKRSSCSSRGEERQRATQPCPRMFATHSLLLANANAASLAGDRPKEQRNPVCWPAWFCSSGPPRRQVPVVDGARNAAGCQHFWF